MRGSMASILSRVCPMREPQAEPDAHESGGGGRREAFGKEDRCQLSGPTRRCYHPPRDRRLTLVDAHHHFWDPATNPYPWLSPTPLPRYVTATTPRSAAATCRRITRGTLRAG